ncbi:hypothetical protein VTN00DRAFT_8897 [Thermoascus crustaceus]|uniref:uncharacterized protein n=1 Tax=Thermoascus crustaceus TaxID=5088 RepID=UPI00374329EF
MPPPPPSHQHHYSTSSQSSLPRASILPTQTNTITTAPSSSSGAPATATAPSSMSTAKARQYAHLHSQLAQLNAHLADTENLLRMTAVQAGDMRFLGGYVGGLFMGAAKVLGEEGVNEEEGQGVQDKRNEGEGRE